MIHASIVQTTPDPFGENNTGSFAEMKLHRVHKLIQDDVVRWCMNAGSSSAVPPVLSQIIGLKSIGDMETINILASWLTDHGDAEGSSYPIIAAAQRLTRNAEGETFVYEEGTPTFALMQAHINWLKKFPDNRGAPHATRAILMSLGVPSRAEHSNQDGSKPVGLRNQLVEAFANAHFLSPVSAMTLRHMLDEIKLKKIGREAILLHLDLHLESNVSPNVVAFIVETFSMKSVTGDYQKLSKAERAEYKRLYPRIVDFGLRNISEEYFGLVITQLVRAPIANKEAIARIEKWLHANPNHKFRWRILVWLIRIDGKSDKVRETIDIIEQLEGEELASAIQSIISVEIGQSETNRILAILKHIAVSGSTVRMIIGLSRNKSFRIDEVLAVCGEIADQSETIAIEALAACIEVLLEDFGFRARLTRWTLDSKEWGSADIKRLVELYIDKGIDLRRGVVVLNELRNRLLPAIGREEHRTLNGARFIGLLTALTPASDKLSDILPLVKRELERESGSPFSHVVFQTAATWRQADAEIIDLTISWVEKFSDFSQCTYVVQAIGQRRDLRPSQLERLAILVSNNAGSPTSTFLVDGLLSHAPADFIRPLCAVCLARTSNIKTVGFLIEKMTLRFFRDPDWREEINNILSIHGHHFFLMSAVIMFRISYGQWPTGLTFKSRPDRSEVAIAIAILYQHGLFNATDQNVKSLASEWPIVSFSGNYTAPILYLKRFSDPVEALSIFAFLFPYFQSIRSLVQAICMNFYNDHRVIEKLIQWMRSDGMQWRDLVLPAFMEHICAGGRYREWVFDWIHSNPAHPAAITTVEAVYSNPGCARYIDGVVPALKIHYPDRVERILKLIEAEAKNGTESENSSDEREKVPDADEDAMLESV